MAGFILGLLSPLGLVFTGVPAIFLGLAGLREVNASDGRLRGQRLAWAGMVLGLLGTLECVGGMAAWGLLRLQEVSARVTCQNNQRVLGVALHLYHDRNSAFPLGTVPNDSLPPEKRLSWLASVLPYLEQAPQRAHDPNKRWSVLAGQLHLDQAWDAEANRPVVTTTIRGFVCPEQRGRSSFSRSEEDERPLCSYPGIAGLGKDAATLPPGDPNAGVFGYDRKTRIDQVTRGVSNAVMVAESASDNGPWAAGGFSTVRGLDREDRPFLGPGRPFGGLHPGIANLLFVDGSARLFRIDAAPEVFENLVRIADKTSTAKTAKAPGKHR